MYSVYRTVCTLCCESLNHMVRQWFLVINWFWLALPNGCQRSNIDTALFTLLYSAVYKIGKKEFLFAFFVQRALELFKLNI